MGILNNISFEIKSKCYTFLVNKDGVKMKTMNFGLKLIKKVAIKNAEKTMKLACLGFNYQPISPRKKQLNKDNG